MGEGNPGWFDPEDASSKGSQSFSNRWTVTQSTDGWSASCEANDSREESWLRYYHRVLSPLQWTTIKLTGKTPAPVPPYSSRLISDFTWYNAAIYTDRSSVYDERGKLVSSYTTDWLPNDVRDRGGSAYSRSLPGMPMANIENDGKHWMEILPPNSKFNSAKEVGP